MIDGDAAGPEGLEGTEDLKGLADRSPATRASDRERDAVVQRVQEAFAEGRLDDTEFDERMRAALPRTPPAPAARPRPSPGPTHGWPDCDPLAP